MKKILLIKFLFLFTTFSAFSRQFTISGYVRDSDSGEDLISANVYDKKSLKGTVTNTYGFYSLTLPEGKIVLKFSYVGYVEETRELDLTSDIEINIMLKPSVALKEVEILATRAEQIENRSQMSRIDVPIQQIKKIPALMGEVDVMKVLQLLPGVQGGTEGQSGIYVRGGGPDQNLITLDGVPVYNVSHLGGFFSVFNADALRNVTLYKGGFPARYGGRLSSVIDISMKEGNNQKLHSEGSIGLITSRLTIEAPIIKNKTSFIVSGRRTYVDALLKPLIALANAGSTGPKTDLTLYFYDLNAKINHVINNKHRIYLSAYTGKDILAIGAKEGTRGNADFYNSTGGITWGNLTSAARWNWQVSNKFFTNTTLTYSQYQYNSNLEIEQPIDKSGKTERQGLRSGSGIQDWSAKFDADYVPNPNHYVKMGLSATNHSYSPGAVQIKFGSANDKVDTTLGSKKLYANEFAAYAEDDFTFGALKMNAGLHASAFAVEGTFYSSLQPRIGINYLLSNNVGLKASFCTMRQYINLLTNEGLGLPNDIWVPSTAAIKPQDAWQAAVGVAKTMWEEYECSIEGYYKQMKNVLAYKAGASFLGVSKDWQEKVIQGDGEAYGTELLIQKKKGRLNGWIGYTLSWNWRQFDALNGGFRFPFRYDRRHDLEMVANYQLNPVWSLSGTWVYSTGNAFSLDNIVYNSTFENNWSNVFNPGKSTLVDISQPSAKNAIRMQPFHRLDIGIQYTKKKKRIESTWSFGAYNFYNRKNPFFVYSRFDSTKNKEVYRQVGLFPIVPNIAWSFKF